MINRKPFGKRPAPETKDAPAPKEYKSYLEHRKDLNRMTQLRKVIITFNNGCSTCDGILRNVSETGARIETVNAPNLPDHFTVEFPFGEKLMNAQKIWKTRSMIGIAAL